MQTVKPPSRRLPGISSHHSARADTDEWLTPPQLLKCLGPFDLDPCSPVDRPWPTAATHYTLDDDGLHMPWLGRVWLNPPYSQVEGWAARMAEHGHGTALFFARVETRWWQQDVWPKASAVLFLAGRLTFYRGDGTRSKAGHNSGGPSALVAYGPEDARLLRRTDLSGAFVSDYVMLGGE